MQTVNIVCVGKIKEDYLKEAIAEYSKRLSRFCKFNIVEVEEELQKSNYEKEIERVKSKEGERISKHLKGFVVALDLKGEMVSSEDFAYIVKKAPSIISFIIGGSNGISSEVLKIADSKIAFGKVTYPHQLMRVIVTEQIYRAFMINSHSVYHK